MKVALERSNELKILVKNKNAYPESGNSYDIKFLGENWLYLKKEHNYMYINHIFDDSFHLLK